VGLVVNARANNTPDEYLARESIFFEEGFENGNLNDYFDAVIDKTLLACKSAEMITMPLMTAPPKVWLLKMLTILY